MPQKPNVPPELEAAIRVLAAAKPDALADLALEAFRALEARNVLIDDILKAAVLPDAERAALLRRIQVLHAELESSRRSVLARYS